MGGGTFATTEGLEWVLRRCICHVRIHRSDGVLLEAIYGKFAYYTVSHRPNAGRGNECYVRVNSVLGLWIMKEL